LLVHQEKDQQKKEDVLDLLRKWIDKNIDYGRLKPEIFIKKGVAYALTIRRGDEEIRLESSDEI